uniref:Uncharacterized protein n=1 Tax=Bartonella schoenbuchensis (strain DSM 13525 / NCTC 13165 / R1) TaxID=687861 RepID=E6YXP3_BARSR|nr:hypothetical protein B11C_10105 [Bartonella schoenbuchensis R1]
MMCTFYTSTDFIFQITITWLTPQSTQYYSFYPMNRNLKQFNQSC